MVLAVSTPNPSPPKKAFLILNGADIHPLTRDVTNLGRMEDNDIVLPGSHVSRYHAQIRKVGAGHLVVDLGSTSGTSVNGRPVDETPLSPGDVISLAGVPVIYGETSGPDRLTPEPETEASPGRPRKDDLGPTDAVDIGTIDRFLDLFDPPEENSLQK